MWSTATKQNLDDENEADRMIEVIEEKICDQTEMNEPIVPWDGMRID